MLVQLRIRDFAIIDQVELELPSGFTVVTGETGAGKSILVDALSLALGGRGRTEVVRTGSEHAEVEALFDVSSQPLVGARLLERDLVGDDPDVLLVRRWVAARGRGKVVINGHLSTVATLSEIVRGLVDISGQHEQQSLLIVEGHIDIVDSFGQLEGQRRAYREAFDRLRTLTQDFQRRRGNEDELLRRADFLRFELEEIDRLDPNPDEFEELEHEERRLFNAEKLKGAAQLAESLLYGDDGSAFDKLGKATSELEALGRIDPELEALSEPLAAARREIEEVARFLQRYTERIEDDPGRLEDVENRLAALRRLCRKHGSSIADVLRRRDELQDELDEITHRDQRLVELEEQLRRQQHDVVVLGQALSEARHAVGLRLQCQIEAELKDVELENACFQVEVRGRGGTADTFDLEVAHFGASGMDAVEFMWSANAGEAPRPLARIASGGELSRLMLAVKTVLAKRDLVSLYVFDEVDAGLGGRAADAIGRKIQAVAQDHQAIAITHLAPIAARAASHLYVSKSQRDERTISRLEQVKGPRRAEEIARMIDGSHVTAATRQAAQDMLARAAPSTPTRRSA